MNEEALGKVARRQWGVFTRAQALEAGATKWAIYRRLGQGDWVAVEAEVYRFRGGHESWHQKVAAATLSLGADSFASHRTAAFLWGLEGLGATPPALIEVTAPVERSRLLRFAKVHHTRRPSKRPVWRSLIPTTPIARTLIDLADVLTNHALFVVFDSARRKRRAVLAELETELKDHGTGRIGSAVLLKMLARARHEPPTGSPLEAEAAVAIERFGLPIPSRQVRMFTPENRFIARVDFAWIEHRVIVQCDSHEFHLTPEAYEKDLRQRRQLESHGWRVIHVTWAMLASDDWLRDLSRLLAAQERKAGQ